MRRAILATTLLISTSAFAQAYKCGAGTEVVYQDRPCAGGVQVVKATPKQYGLLDETRRAADPTESGAVACRANASHFFKDPDSVKVESDVVALVPMGKPSTTFRRWLINVNAKNSFGGYVGVKPYLCVTSVNGQTVTAVVPWE